MTTDERIARLRDLDSKRTPGEWIAGVHPGNHRIHIIKPICFGKYVGKLPECEGGAIYFRDEGTAQFIAAAPEMMQIINELHAENAALRAKLEVAVNGLEYYQYLEPEGFKAKQALAEIRK